MRDNTKRYNIPPSRIMTFYFVIPGLLYPASPHIHDKSNSELQDLDFLMKELVIEVKGCT